MKYNSSENTKYSRDFYFTAESIYRLFSNYTQYRCKFPIYDILICCLYSHCPLYLRFVYLYPQFVRTFTHSHLICLSTQSVHV